VKAATENLTAVAETLPHAVQIIQGTDTQPQAARPAGQPAHTERAHTERAHGGSEHAHAAPPPRAGHDHDERGAAGRQSTAPAANAAAARAGGIARNVGGPTC
jgi:hypothetical protein